MSYNKKFSNSPFWYDPIMGQSYQVKNDVPIFQKDRVEYWDSVLEFNVYEKLTGIFPIGSIHRQQVLSILPKNEFFPKWTWKIDFIVDCSPKEPIYIEAKGAWLCSSPESKIFWRMLRTLEIIQPKVFQRLIIVGNIARWYIPSTKIVVYPFEELDELIKNMDG